MSEQQYEIEARMHDTLVAKDKRIEELMKENEELKARAKFLADCLSNTSYDEPTYGDY